MAKSRDSLNKQTQPGLAAFVSTLRHWPENMFQLITCDWYKVVSYIFRTVTFKLQVIYSRGL